MRKVFFACFTVMFVISSFFCSEKIFAAKHESTSPVSYTAPITLYWLSKAQVPEAVEYVKYLNAESIVKPDNISQYERVEKINKIYHEIRYKSLNEFIAANGYKNVVDLGCGVSPRFLYTSSNGISYVGVELEDVVKVLNIYAPNFLSEEKKSLVHFATADVADRDEMTNAADILDGKICIVEDSLLMYLPRNKQKAMLENIRDILKKHGGCFVTSDFVAGEIFMSACETVYGVDDGRIVASETQKLYENISETIFNDTMFKSEKEAVKFIEEVGLKVEKRPLFNNTPNIRSIRDLNSRDIERINAMTTQKFLWVMTVDEGK